MGGLGFKYIIDAIRKTESFFLRSKLGGPELPPGGNGYKIALTSRCISYVL